jgi:hypothetical protein
MTEVGGVSIAPVYVSDVRVQWSDYYRTEVTPKIHVDDCWLLCDCPFPLNAGFVGVIVRKSDNYLIAEDRYGSTLAPGGPWQLTFCSPCQTGSAGCQQVPNPFNVFGSIVTWKPVQPPASGQCGEAGVPPTTVPPSGGPPPSTCCPTVLPCGEDSCLTPVPEPCESDVGTCTDFVAGPEGDLVFPPPGSREWCAAQDAIKTFFISVGDNLIATVRNSLGLGSLKTGTGSAVYDKVQDWTNPAGYLANALWNGLEALGVDARSRISEFMQQLDLILRKTEGAAVGAFAIGIVRGVVRMLSGLQVGFTFGVHFTVRIPIELPVLERVINYLSESLFPSLIPDPHNAVYSWIYGELDTNIRDCWLRANGANPDVWQSVITAAAQRVGVPEWLEFYRRFDAPDDAALVKLRYRGWKREEDLLTAHTLYTKLPSDGQLIDWKMSLVLDDAYVNRYDLADGFLDFWDGYGKQNIYPKGITESSTYRAYCRARNMPNQGQAREYLYRLWVGAPGVEANYTEDDYRLSLEASGMPPPAVEWAMETRYQLVSAGDVDYLYSLRLISAENFAGWLRSTGQDPATLTYQMIGRNVARARGWAGQGILISPGLVAAAVQFKQLSIGDGADAIAPQGYTANDLTGMLTTEALRVKVSLAQRGYRRASFRLQQSIIQAYQIGTITAQAAQAALVASGWTADAAESFTKSLDIAERSRLAQQGISALHSAYMQGRINIDRVRQSLTSAGITPLRVEQYASAWESERVVQKPTASVGDIKRWVKEGLLSVKDAEQWLANLGYVNPTLMLQVEDIQWQLAQAAQKADAAAQKKTAAAAKALAQAQALAARLAAQAQATLRRQEPLSTLKRALTQGLLSTDQVMATMLQQGYSAEQSQLYLQEWGYAHA